MQLTIRSVAYDNFRNLERVELHPSEKFTIICGANAIGKTNCIEGICLLTNGSSFRKLSSTSDLIGPAGNVARVRQQVVGEKRQIDIECMIQDNRKYFQINEKRRRASECCKVLPSVLFNPDDLLVVKGSASGRRDLFDAIGSQLSEAYRRVLRDYTRALAQRNSLLKNEQYEGDAFESWTGALVNAGSVLYLYRKALVNRLKPYIQKSYQSLSRKEEMSVSYKPFFSVGSDDKEAVAAAFYQTLNEHHPEEVHRRLTVAGPHHDDIELLIEGRPLRTFGSQGQQRSAILAIKMAHATLVKDMLGYFPVFLLDDVMSELDEKRREALFSLIDTGMQTIVTTANIDYFSSDEQSKALVVSLADLKQDMSADTRMEGEDA
jgi:DNA replication and repair protein RecF